MPALRELQREVLAELLGGGAAGARHVRPTALGAARRLEIYRHNVQASLTEALRAVYPTVAELVGRGFFRFAAQQYIAGEPAKSPGIRNRPGGTIESACPSARAAAR